MNEVERVFKSESRRALATLIRLLGDFDLAEDALQEAFAAAVQGWPAAGVPANPRAWLIATAKHKAIDRIRRDRRGRDLLEYSIEPGHEDPADPADFDGEQVDDDQLRLIFTCCHPSLAINSRVALSLREVCGLSTEQIARAYLVTREAMKRRLSRAKAHIRDNRIPYEIPSRTELARRLDAVLQVIYLVYNEGYSASSGESHIRGDLAQEGVMLARLVSDLVPEPDAVGLLALLLFHESRRSARVDEHGEPVDLESQDRALWDRSLISEAYQLVYRAILSGRIGPYTIQAAIASVHAVAPSVGETDWDLIVRYYSMLMAAQPSPIVKLNRAIAIGMRDGPAAAIAIVDLLIGDGPLAEYHLAHAARAFMLRRSGDLSAARESYGRALELVTQEPERRYLQRRLAEIS